MSEREEMRRLIDVIERGVMSASVEQNIEDMRLFANTVSFIANKVDVKLKQQTQKPKTRPVMPSLPKLPVQKTKPVSKKPEPKSAAKQPVLPAANVQATRDKDFERLRSVKPAGTVGTKGTIRTGP
jgi:hypothetical protein